MVSIEACRAQISSYVTKERIISGQNDHQMNSTGYRFSMECVYRSYFRYLMLHFLRIFNLVENSCFTVDANYQNLLRDGDIESNPGPSFRTRKVIQGSFHQGHLKFGHTAGMQCACNSLFALCWSTVKRVTL